MLRRFPRSGERQLKHIMDSAMEDGRSLVRGAKKENKPCFCWVLARQLTCHSRVI